MIAASLPRRAVIGGGVATLVCSGPLRAAAVENGALDLGETVVGSGFTVSLPTSYYRPKDSKGRTVLRPKTGIYDDTLLVAADYASGRTAAVSRTTCDVLLRDAGEPEALVGPLSDLKELGRPARVAALLARRRDGDPANLLPQPRTEVLSSARDGNELRFVLKEATYTATSTTKAAPSARIVQGRAVFVPASAERPASLLTAWAGSAAPSVQCVPTPCEPEGSLRFDCPAPKCETGGELPLDATDLAIVGSLRAT